MMTTLVRLPMLVAVAKSLADAGAAQNERRPDFMDFYLADSITEHRDVAARNPRVVDRVMQLVIRIIDCKKRGWGHVTFDDFSCEGDLSRK